MTACSDSKESESGFTKAAAVAKALNDAGVPCRGFYGADRPGESGIDSGGCRMEGDNGELGAELHVFDEADKARAAASKGKSFGASCAFGDTWAVCHPADPASIGRVAKALGGELP